MDTVLGLLATLVRIEAFLILVRVLLSWFPGIDPGNPLVRGLRAVVDPVLAPFRRILPTFAGIDFSPVLAVLVLYEIARVLDVAGAGGGVSAGGVARDVVRELLTSVAVMFILVVLLRLCVSLFHASPFHPLVMMIRQISSPLVRPFTPMAPRVRSFDAPALIALVVYVVALIVIQAVFRIATG